MDDPIPHSKQDPPRKYVVGDEVTGGIVVSHIQNLLSIEVVFCHSEDETITMILGDVPATRDRVSIMDQSDMTEVKFSEVELSAEVGLEHVPGLYELSQVVFYTASGQEVIYKREHITDRPAWLVTDRPDFSTTLYWFEVIPEPGRVESFALMKDTDYQARIEAEPPSDHP